MSSGIILCSLHWHCRWILNHITPMSEAVKYISDTSFASFGVWCIANLLNPFCIYGLMIDWCCYFIFHIHFKNYCGTSHLNKMLRIGGLVWLTILNILYFRRNYVGNVSSKTKATYNYIVKIFNRLLTREVALTWAVLVPWVLLSNILS